MLGIPPHLSYFENKITFPIASNLFLFKCYIYYSQGTSDDIYNTVGVKVCSTLDFFQDPSLLFSKMEELKVRCQDSQSVFYLWQAYTSTIVKCNVKEL